MSSVEGIVRLAASMDADEFAVVAGRGSRGPNRFARPKEEP